MDLKEIQALIKFVSKSGAQEVSLETEDFKINIKTASGALNNQQLSKRLLRRQCPLLQRQQLLRLL